jgi:hypothetical protein
MTPCTLYDQRGRVIALPPEDFIPADWSPIPFGFDGQGLTSGRSRRRRRRKAAGGAQ